MTDPQPHPTEQFPTATPPTVEVEEAPRRRGRKRVALVAALAVAVLAVGGGGGFAIGRATAPETASTSTTDQQFPGGGPGGQLGTPPDGGGPMGTLPGQDETTDDGTAEEPTA